MVAHDTSDRNRPERGITVHVVAAEANAHDDDLLREMVAMLAELKGRDEQ